MGRLAFLVFLALTVPASAETVTGQARIIDGDTLEIGDRRIRLFGIDAPEMDQLCLMRNGDKLKCGAMAQAELASMVGDVAMLGGRDGPLKLDVVCQGGQSDKYGRLVAVCWAAGANPAGVGFGVNYIDLGAWMVGNGWAVAYRKYSDRYVGQEESAREWHRGIWDGEFVMPWEWRKGD